MNLLTSPYFCSGDTPFRVESMKVLDKHGKDPAVVMELDLKWSGDANIAIQIKVRFLTHARSHAC